MFVMFCMKHSIWRILSSSPGQYASPFRFVHEGVLANHTITMLNHPPYSPDTTHVTSIYFKMSKRSWRGEALRAWNQPKQKQRWLSTSWQKGISSTVLHSGKFGRCGAGIAKSDTHIESDWVLDARLRLERKSDPSHFKAIKCGF